MSGVGSSKPFDDDSAFVETYFLFSLMNLFFFCFINSWKTCKKITWKVLSMNLPKINWIKFYWLTIVNNQNGSETEIFEKFSRNERYRSMTMLPSTFTFSLPLRDPRINIYQAFPQNKFIEISKEKIVNGWVSHWEYAHLLLSLRKFCFLVDENIFYKTIFP